MKFSSVTALLSTAVVLSACAESGPRSRPVVPRVSDILSDRDCAEYKLLSVESRPDRNGAIFIVGEEKECDVFAAELSTCDYRDNVDGSLSKDGLADFCGERICSIADMAGGSYSSYLSRGLGDSLRTRMVDMCLLALDTVCYVSPYDLNGLVSQPRAKLIVLVSPMAYKYGKYDLDSLFGGSGCAVRVINPLEEMIKEAGDATPGAVGLLSSSASAISAGIYGDCVAFSSESGHKDKLISFLDAYLASGHTEKLKALIVDDLSVDCEALEMTLARVKSVMNEEFLTYSPLLADNFRIVNPRRTVSSKCIEILRSGNMFTHLILRPRSDKYMTVSRPETVLIPYNERYVRELSNGL